MNLEIPKNIFDLARILEEKMNLPKGVPLIEPQFQEHKILNVYLDLIVKRVKILNERIQEWNLLNNQEPLNQLTNHTKIQNAVLYLLQEMNVQFQTPQIKNNTMMDLGTDLGKLMQIHITEMPE